MNNSMHTQQPPPAYTYPGQEYPPKKRKLGVWSIAALSMFALCTIGKVVELTESPEDKAAREARKQKRQRQRRAVQDAAAQRAREAVERAAARREAERQPVGRVSARDLVAHYHGNEVQADAYYKGRYFTITGRVSSISKDLFDSIYVTLIGTDKFGINTVHIDPGPELGPQWAAGLSKRQRITVICKVTGMTLGSVSTDDCRGE